MSNLDQWIRRVSLTIVQGSQALDLSQLRFTFKTTQSDTETPNNCAIRVFNLSEQTARDALEYTRVVLEAGYQDGNFGVVFDGTIKQFRRGRENPTDTYLDILAADGDLAYNFAFVNQSIAAGSAAPDRLKVAAKAMADQGVDEGDVSAVGTGGVLPRGKVMYGMARNYARDIAKTAGTTWSIQNGKLTMIPLTGYLPGEAVVLTAQTGMIGVPQQTDQGIEIRCLLNPKIRIGGTVKIDNASINQTINKDPSQPIPFDQWTGLQQLASVSNDGLYRVYVAEHFGDTRGNDWYSDLICLSVDPSSPIDNSVQAY